MRTGSILLELAIALSIGITVMLQLTCFLVMIVQQMHGFAAKERRILQEEVILDLLLQDISTSVDQQALPGNPAAIVLNCWRLHAGQAMPQLTEIVWKKVGVRIQRHIQGYASPQVFGDLLQGFEVDHHTRRICFTGEDKKLYEYDF